jgi:hypothetical protein
MYRRGMLAAYIGGAADARTHQRALRHAAAAGDDRAVKVFSLWLDAVVPDSTADADTRLAEAAQLSAQSPRQGFYRAVHALWLYRAGKAEEAGAEAQKAVDGEGSEGKTVAAAVFALASRKLGREDDARLVRDELETTRKRLSSARPEEWVVHGDPAEWPTYLGFLLLTDEFDRAGRPAPPPIPPAK